MRLAATTALAVLFMLGCDSDPSTDAGAGTDAAAPPSGPIAVLSVPATGAVDYRSAPFPNDLFLGADGTVDLATPPARGELWANVQAITNTRHGFCRSCPVAFPIEGSIDRATLPADAAIGASADGSEPIVMMRADGSGGFLPVDVDYQSDADAITVRAGGRRVLLPATQYIVALTSAISGTGGEPLSASPQFAALRDQTGVDPAATRAGETLLPAIDALEAAGVARSSIVAVSVFTTDDTGVHLAQMRAVVDAAPAPVATLDQVFRRSDGTLDELLGAPAEELPGFDVAAAAGTDGDWAIAHDNIEMIVLGAFEAPRIVGGTGFEIGFIRRDAEGAVTAGPQESVPFALVVPVGADLSNLPIAMAHTGLGGTRTMALSIGNQLAGIGVATISTDPYQHGARAAVSFDLNHNFRGGDLGPDGWAEHDGGEVTLRIQGISGADVGLALHPSYLEASTSQIVSDGMAAIRFMHEGDLTALQGADSALSGLAFNSDQTFWVGLSNGSLTGMSAVTGYPGVEAALMNVGPGLFQDTICHSPAFRGIVGTILTIYGIRGDFDGVTQRVCMHPLMSFLGLLTETVTPAAVMHYLFDAPTHDQSPPDVLFQYSLLDEVIGTANAENVLLAANVPTAGETTFSFSDVPTGTPPFHANRVTPNGTVTVGGWMYGEADHSFIARRRGESSRVPPYRFPFTERPAPIQFDNPIDAAQGQMTAFFSSFMADGRSTIQAPP